MYLPGTVDYDAEGDDPHELITSGDDLSAVWDLIIQAFDAIEAAQYVYNPGGPNSNTTVDSALVRAGLSEPVQDNLFGFDESWSPGSGATLDVEPNTFTTFDGDANRLVETIARAHPGISYVDGSAAYTGAPGATSYFSNLALGVTKMVSGFMLTSGDGTPPDSNTRSNYGQDLGLPGLQSLSDLVRSVFPTRPETYDATYLTFSFNVTDPSISSIALDLAFGSDEYPEYANNFVDIGAVIVNGQHAAFFDGDPSRPLSVLSSNLGAFQNNSNGSMPIEYDGVSARLTILAPVHQGLNTITIAVADTGDHIYDSALFVSNLRPSEFSTSGVRVQIDAGDDKHLDNVLAGTNAGEYFVAGDGDDTVNAGGGDDAISLGYGSDIAYAGAGNDQIKGSAGDDQIFGEDGDDVIIAASGVGNDLYDGGDGVDTVSYQSAYRRVTVDLTAGAAVGTDIDSDTLSGIENVFGGSGADTITGSAAANHLKGAIGGDRLSGLDGDDRLEGGVGADELMGGAGVDVAVYTASKAGVTVNLTSGQGAGGEAAGDTLSGIENLIGSAFADVLTGANGVANSLEGGDGADQLFGLGGDDVLMGGAGADLLSGGLGVDRVSYAGSGAGVSIILGAASATGGDAQGDTLTSIEDVTGSAFADTIRGDGAANQLLAGAGDDVLAGLAGDDTLNGGDGVDTADYSAATDRVIAFLAFETATRDGHGGIDRLIGIENLIGSAFDDVLMGDDFDNRLVGGAGRDDLAGGWGNDEYHVDTGDKVLESLSQGVDRVIASASWTALAQSEIEFISTSSQSGLSAIDLTGSNTDNVINGNAGANRLDGMGGDDTIHGRDGDDIVLAGLGLDRVYGGAGADEIYGQDGDDGLRGEAGNDILDGGDGDDTLYGADGTDRLVGGAGVDRAYGGAHADTLYGGAGDDSLRGEEGDDNAWGDDGDDFLYGDAGADRLDGGGGRDVIYGGVGNDRVYGGADGDRAYGQDGDDLMWGGAGDDTLSGNDDNDTIRGEDGDDTVRGDNGDDALYGQAGADIVYGGEGQDTAYGGDDADQLYGGGGNDIVYGDGGDDSVRGEDGTDSLYGGSGNDFLYGGDGNDRLEGGAGIDRMYGQAGADTFWFDDTHLTAPGVSTDRIHDFNAADGDVIDLSAIDANSTAGGDQAFVKVAAFTGVAGQYVLQTSSGYVTALFDTNGDGVADLSLRVDGASNGVAGWVL